MNVAFISERTTEANERTNTHDLALSRDPGTVALRRGNWAARVCPPGTCTRISTRLGRGGGGRIEDGPGREGEGGRTGRHEGGGWSDESERGRSVSAPPIFFAALRAAVRVGRPDRIGNAALGLRSVRDA